MQLNLLATLVGLVLLAVGVGLALGVGWALALTGAALVAVGLFRDDGRETP